MEIEMQYIRLLVDGCLKLNSKSNLLISYDKINEHFIDKLVKYAQDKGVKDIYLDEFNSFQIHDILKSSTLDEIKNNEIFNASIWDEYAKKKASFLMICSEIPNLMDDVPSEKIALKSKIMLESKPLYREYQAKGLVPWCIAAVPNKYWASDMFSQSKDPVSKFWKILSDICMLEGNAVKNWDKFLKSQEKIKEKLNSLKITKLFFKNSLGTNLEVELPNDAIWQNASENNYIVNIPSYEVFTTPNYHTTNGLVYSSKPLIYNGKVIDKFYLEFKNGKVINFKAETGEDILKEIIKSEKGMQSLGEVALVNYNSPISKTNLCFKTTLLDENASCHVALGMGFLECLKDGVNKKKDELDEIGINACQNHVDFMIGTKDLLVEALTKDGKITIMKNGNLVI